METRYSKLEVFLSVFLLMTPLILINVNNEIRPSISDYAYSKHNIFFALLISSAGTMFIYNGWIRCKHWYNIILGLSLHGVVVTPHLDYPILHYCFASVFFLGSTAVMIIFSSQEQRLLKVLAGSLILLAMIFHFLMNWYSLLWAEWIGLVPICIHFIGESTGKID